jgi:hypothetical protein
LKTVTTLCAMLIIYESLFMRTKSMINSGLKNWFNACWMPRKR